MALGMLWMINITIAAGAAAALTGLVVVYARNVRAIRSPFTIGLLLFGLLFLAQNLAAILVYISMSDQGFTSTVALPMLALNVAGLAGVGALFYVTWR